ncbi:MAG: type II toxin-antitoxin system RelE/ParE family toxin [Planctomycetaceae bacterium]
MTRIEGTNSAREDLRSIHDFITRDSPLYALRFIDRIKAKVEGILFPEAGSIVPEWDRPDIRETFVASYRVIYRIKDDDVEVLTVIHGARQLSDRDDVGSK